MISLTDKIVMMGSCFSTEIGNRLIENGFDVCLNPFGILFNPASIASAIQRLDSGETFSARDVIQRTDDASLGKTSFVSFSHHGSFARPTAKDFLENANIQLEKACRAFRQADVCILTFGTAWVFRHIPDGKVVANCHKIPAREFSRELMSVGEILEIFIPIIEGHPEKRWILTVSPIRHKADGLHGNQVSKSTLLLAQEYLVQKYPEAVRYFPSYEIMTDELRDYRYYAADGSHPTDEAVSYIFDKFLSL